MSEWVLTKWKRCKDAFKKGRTTTLHDNGRPQGEGERGRVYGNDKKIVAALERIVDQGDVNAEQRKAEELERGRWERKRFRLEVAAVIAAFAGTYVLLDTLWDTHKGNVDANRAWISVDRMSLNFSMRAGKPIEYRIGESNVGKSPAIAIQFVVDNGYVPAPEGYNFAKMTFSKIDMCTTGRPMNPGGALFPQKEAGINLTSDVVRKGVVAPKDMKSTIFYSRGCITYKTMDTVGKTRFCLLFSPRWDDAGIIRDFQSTNCTNGNDAEWPESLQSDRRPHF